jgi:hypothetical protein
MEFVASILAVILTAGVILLLNYYRRLLNDGRREYPREELINAHNFIVIEWQRLTSGDPVTGYVGAAAGALLGYMLSYTGGAYGEHYESFFFHSAILPGLWFLGHPFLRDKAEEMQWPSSVRKFIDNDTTFFFAFSAMTASQALIAYGFYHALSFIWIGLNFLVIIGLVLYYFYKQDTTERTGLPEKTRRENRI